MKFRVKTSLLVVLGLAFCATSLKAQSTVTASPSSLAFGVPTGSSTSAPQTVTVIATDGPVKIDGLATSGAGFSIQSGTDGCSGTTLAPPATSCTVNVVFSSTSTTLVGGSLRIQGSSFPTVSVALSGAYGAIKLFDEINVGASKSGATLGNPYAFKTAPLTLNCSTVDGPISATLSSTPDGSGNVLVDNFLTLQVGGSGVGTGSPSGNVCAGGTSDSSGEVVQQDCFTTAGYQTPASNNQLDGKDPDTFTTAGGVAKINVAGYFNSSAQQNATFALLDGGGKVASSTIFLVTNCSSPGVQTGGTLTGNPLDPSQPGSLTPQFLFNTTPGNHITFAANFLNADQFDANSMTPVTPTVTDTGISQSEFYSYVTGTSAAPATCVLLSGEVDAQGSSLCKAFTITCTDSSGSSAGVNCPQQTLARTLLFETRLDSPDAVPYPFAAGTGPGLLEGSDTWTSTTPCVFTAGELAGQPCPQDPLTEFKGAADPTPGGTGRSVNSTFIPVYNMPLPQTTVTIPAATASGWVNSWTVVVNFASNPATYPASDTTVFPVPQNGFVPASIASFTYGQVTPVPDPTYPVSGDTTKMNGAVGSCATTPPAPFLNSATFTYNADGQYNDVHYFATDCANTEELNFVLSTDPKANWAHFKTVPIKIDTVAPTIGAITFNPTSTGNIFAVGQPVMANFGCTDNPSGSGIDPTTCFGTAAMATGTPTTGIASGHNIPTSQAGTYTFTVTAKDNAGNPATPQIVTYQVVGSSELLLLNLAPGSVSAGSNLTYRIAVLNLGPSVADNVVVTDTIPAGTTLVSAGFAKVACSLAGCSDAPGFTTCGHAPSGGSTTVTCIIPTVALLKTLTGDLVKIVVNVGRSASSPLKDTATGTEANQDPVKGDNTATATTKITH